MNKSLFIVLMMVFFFCSTKAIAGTGIVEVNSKPSGAKVYMDGTYVGKTPYSNPEVQIGKHRIKIQLNKDFPSQYWDFLLDEVTPQTRILIFEGKSQGQFTGIEEKTSIEKHKGNIQFASIPSGAILYINGKKIKKTPIGYRDVDVGRYSVKFVLNGVTLSDDFDIVHNQTIKLIADFNKRKIINRYKEHLLAVEKEREHKIKLKAEQEKIKKIEEIKRTQEKERRSPKILFSEKFFHGIRDLANGKDIIIPFDRQIVQRYGIPDNKLIIKPIENQYDKYALGGWKYKYSLKVKSKYSFGGFYQERVTISNPALPKYQEIVDEIIIPSKGTLKIKVIFEGSRGYTKSGGHAVHLLYDKKGSGNHNKQPNSLSGSISWIPN